MVHQGRWGIRPCSILLIDKGGINSQSPDVFLLASISLELLFTQNN